MDTCCMSMGASWLTSGNNLKRTYVGTPDGRGAFFVLRLKEEATVDCAVADAAVVSPVNGLLAGGEHDR